MNAVGRLVALLVSLWRCKMFISDPHRHENLYISIHDAA